MTMFCDFVREGMDSPPYEEVTDIAALKQIVEEKLEEYNTEVQPHSFFSFCDKPSFFFSLVWWR